MKKDLEDKNARNAMSAEINAIKSKLSAEEVRLLELTANHSCRRNERSNKSSNADYNFLSSFGSKSSSNLMKNESNDQAKLTAAKQVSYAMPMPPSNSGICDKRSNHNFFNN